MVAYHYYHTWNGTLCSTLVLDSVMKVGCRAVLRMEGISALIVLCNNVMNTCLTFIGGFPYGHPTQPQQVFKEMGKYLLINDRHTMQKPCMVL